MIIIKQLFMPCYALQDILIGLARAGMRFQARQLQKAAAIKIGIFWAEDRSVSIGLRRGNPGIISIEALIQAWGAMPAVWQLQPRESSNHKATPSAQSAALPLCIWLREKTISRPEPFRPGPAPHQHGCGSSPWYPPKQLESPLFAPPRTPHSPEGPPSCHLEHHPLPPSWHRASAFGPGNN